MKTKNSLFLKIALSLALGSQLACQSTTVVDNKTDNSTANKTMTENKSSANASAENKNSTSNVSQPAENKTDSNSSTKTVLLTTPTEVYKYAYAARKSKDVEGLKRVMSKDALEFLTILSDNEPVEKALLQMTETPQAATDESRNEKISGDRATLEYPDEKGKWKTMDFVKEDGGWKITVPKADKETGGMPKK